MRGISAINRMLRGEVSAGTATLEAVRRVNAGLLRRREQRQLAQLNRQQARLTPEFSRLSRAQLLEHFRTRTSPKFFPGFINTIKTATLQRELFQHETDQMLVEA